MGTPRGSARRTPALTTTSTRLGRRAAGGLGRCACAEPPLAPPTVTLLGQEPPPAAAPRRYAPRLQPRTDYAGLLSSAGITLFWDYHHPLPAPPYLLPAFRTANFSFFHARLRKVYRGAWDARVVSSIFQRFPAEHEKPPDFVARVGQMQTRSRGTGEKKGAEGGLKTHPLLPPRKTRRPRSSERSGAQARHH